MKIIHYYSKLFTGILDLDVRLVDDERRVLEEACDLLAQLRDLVVPLHLRRPADFLVQPRLLASNF